MSATLTQTAAAAFPDRPAQAGVGLQIDLASGLAGAYLAVTIPAGQSRLAVSAWMKPGDVAGGRFVLMRGLSEAGEPAFQWIVDPDQRRIECELPDGPTLEADWPADGPAWHNVQVVLDDGAGSASLWIDGRLRAMTEGWSGYVEVREVQLGAIYKQADAIGRIDVDEWMIGDARLSPAVKPTSSYADDPSRWLVVYNAADADSRQWAEYYRAERRVPYANLCGLDLPLDETISESQFADLRDAIDQYLWDNGLASQILGLLLGYRVPGYYLRADSRREAIAGQLHRMDGWTGAVTNPLSLHSPPQRPSEDSLNGDRLTARIDGPTLADGLAPVDRAAAIETNGLAGGDNATLWFDPVTTGTQHQAWVTPMLDWGRAIDRQRLLLPFRMSEPTDPPSEVGFDSIANDGFYWGWRGSDVPSEFFATPAGDRIFCYQATNVTATSPTLRTAPGGWTLQALQAGYAAALGSSRDISLTATPLPDRFFDALRTGWSLAEAWAVAAPLWREGLELIGDPLLRLAFPRTGWRIFGPLDSPAQPCDQPPLAVLRDEQTSWTIDPALLPTEGQRALFRIIRTDAQGRRIDGGATVPVQRIGDALVTPPTPPAWPAAPGWSATLVDQQWQLQFIWARPFNQSGITRVELIEQLPGQSEQVVELRNCPPYDRGVTFGRTAGSAARYRLRAFTSQGGWCDSPLSQWLTADEPDIAELQTLPTA